jgi:hypothetical protein
MAKLTFKQRVNRAVKREVAAQKVLKSKKSTRPQKAKAKRDIANARRSQKRNYKAARDKIKTGENFRTKDAVRKKGKERKKSSQKGRKTKATSKKTAKRSQRGGKKKKR